MNPWPPRSSRSIGSLASATELNRQNLYRMLSEDGNPTLGNLITLLDVLRIDIEFRPRAA